METLETFRTAILVDVPGVTVERWNRYDWIAGKGDALVAARAVRPEWLPGRPGNNKTSQRWGCPEGQWRRLIRYQDMNVPCVTITKQGSRSFRVCVTVSEEEQRRRAQLEKVREERETREVRAVERLRARKPIDIDLDNNPITMATLRALKAAGRRIQGASSLIEQRPVASNRLDRAVEDLKQAYEGVQDAIHLLLVQRPLDFPAWVSLVTACEGLLLHAMHEGAQRLSCGARLPEAFGLLEDARSSIRAAVESFQEATGGSFDNTMAAGGCNDWSLFARMFVASSARARGER
jgi:hypothetical protein